MKRKLAVLFSWVLTMSYAVFPNQSQAIQEVDDWMKGNDKPKNVQKEIIWTKSLSKYYAKALMSAQYEQWDTKSEFRALAKLWGKESAWDHTAANPKSSAYGIPQLLKLKPDTPAPEQIARGLAYIEHRYGKPSVAWAHWRKHGWY
jgi:hypothetical protein